MSIEFRNITKRYGDDGRAPLVVKGISFTVPTGTLTTILGPSGCGKTTTLRMIAGLEAPSAGQIFVDGREVTTLGPAERNVSMVFQSYALFPHMNVLANVSYGLDVSGAGKAEARQRAQAAMASVGLANFDARLPSELSGGQQQRVAVARAIVLEPRVLLFDEPLSNLDAKLRRYVRQEIRDLQQSLGLTVVYVTHDQEEALAVSDTVVVMSNATIAQKGSPRELHDRPRTRFVADFIGGANVLPCQVASVQGEQATVRLGALTLQTNQCEGSAMQRHVAVRPNRVALLPAGSPNALQAVIQKATYVGEQMEYMVQTPLGDLFVTSADTDSPLAAGTSVAVAFGEGDVVLLGD